MNNFTVLVVDDTVANLELLESILEEAHYRVRVALSGEAAIKSMEVQVPDLILMDIMMPQMNGFETAQAIKTHPKWTQIPIIFISAKDEIDDKINAFASGGVDYIVKPFYHKEVLARIQTHLAIYKLQYELQEKIKLIDEHIITSDTDIDGTITHVSQALCTISGYTKTELLGKNHRLLRHPDMKDEVYTELWETITQGKTWHGELKNLKKEGDYYWVDATISPKFDANGTIIGYHSFRQLITDHKKVQELSITDPLTQLYNRRHFNDLFPVAIATAKRSKTLLSFLMIDIDFFKRYNDTYGHQEGDTVLIRIGETLKLHFKRLDDACFRLGGEEFCAIIHTQTPKDAHTIAQSLHHAVQALAIPHEASEVAPVVTISSGMASVDFSHPKAMVYDTEMLYKIADEALYRAKTSGRNRCDVTLLSPTD